MIQLKPYQITDFPKVNSYFPKNEIAKYTNGGGIEYYPSSQFTNLIFTYYGMITKLLAVE